MPPITSAQPRVSTNPQLVEDESFAINQLKVQADEADRRFCAVEASAAILRSKQAAIVDRENFLFSEIWQLGEHLLCKFLPFAFSLFLLALFEFILIFSLRYPT